MSHSVVVGVEDVASSGAAVDWAADEAHFRGARLHLVQAWQWARDNPAPLEATLVREASERTLGTLVGQASDRYPDLAVSSAAVEAAPRETLTALSAEAQLLVVGSRGLGGFPGLLTGSTTLHVAAQAVCPVVVVPEAPEAVTRTVGGVAVGLHPRESNDEVLSFAFEAAQRRRLPLWVVHAWSYPLIRLSGHPAPPVSGHPAPPVYEEGRVEAEEVRAVAEILAGWREKYPGVPVEEDVVRSAPAKRLVTVSATQHLVVVGRHGKPDGPVRRLGSVSQAVVQHAKCPVAVIPLG
jgi:nucleotide-binding universal stress UspA family protein